MSLYPDGHPPFRVCGLYSDDLTIEAIQNCAQETSLKSCLHGAYKHMAMGRLYVEQLRIDLFRAEQLVETQPLPPKEMFICLPHHISAMLETLDATRKCLEEWLESQAYQVILAAYLEGVTLAKGDIS